MRVTCGKAFAQQRRFHCDCRARPTNRCDHIAIPVAESDDLIAFHFLMAAEPDVVATFLRRGCRPIAMDDRRVEKICLMKGRYRIRENGVKTAIGLPSLKAL